MDHRIFQALAFKMLLSPADATSNEFKCLPIKISDIPQTIVLLPFLVLPQTIISIKLIYDTRFRFVGCYTCDLLHSLLSLFAMASSILKRKSCIILMVLLCERLARGCELKKKAFDFERLLTASSMRGYYLTMDGLNHKIIMHGCHCGRRHK